MLAAVKISQLHKQFGNLDAVSGLDFEIPKGSFFGLLGPNGAGKSTLINIMAGLVGASSGSVSIMGYDVRRNWRQARQSLGVVPQELVVDPFFTVSEMLRLQAGYFGCKSSAWIEELLDILNLSDKANTNLQELSGGMKRRVLIAQALVHKPDVVLLDEPTAGVDVELRQVLWKFIKLIDGFRYGFFGVSEVDILISLIIVSVFFVVVSLSCLWLLHIGYKIRN